MEAAEGQDRVDTTFKLNVKGTTRFGSLTLIGRITSEAGPNTGQSSLHVHNLDFAYFLIIPCLHTQIVIHLCGVNSELQAMLCCYCHAWWWTVFLVYSFLASILKTCFLHA